MFFHLFSFSNFFWFPTYLNRGFPDLSQFIGCELQTGEKHDEKHSKFTDRFNLNNVFNLIEPAGAYQNAGHDVSEQTR